MGFCDTLKATATHLIKPNDTESNPDFDYYGILDREHPSEQLLL